MSTEDYIFIIKMFKMSKTNMCSYVEMEKPMEKPVKRESLKYM